MNILPISLSLFVIILVLVGINFNLRRIAEALEKLNV